MTIYRKPTFTGQGVNFLSACFKNFKLNTFNTLLFRAYRLTSSFHLFHNEITFVKNFFKENGFTEKVFYGKLKQFLNKLYSNPTRQQGPQKLNLFFKLPFLSDNTNTYLKKEIAAIFNKYLPQISPNIIFYDNYKIKNFVNHKEKLPISYESGILYKYECSQCHLVYPGSTIQSP